MILRLHRLSTPVHGRRQQAERGEVAHAGDIQEADLDPRVGARRKAELRDPLVEERREPGVAGQAVEKLEGEAVLRDEIGRASCRERVS